jgi:hypothetical protein
MKKAACILMLLSAVSVITAVAQQPGAPKKSTMYCS